MVKFVVKSTFSEQNCLMKIFFLLLAKNEEDSIGKVIDDLKSYSTQQGLDILVGVANDSTDRTETIANERGAVVFNCGGKGLGNAYRVGVEKALAFRPDIIVTLDSDGQSQLDEIQSFIQPIISGEADVVTGSRFLQENSIKYAYPKINRFGIHLLSAYLSFMLGQRHTDSHGGIRSLRSSVARGQKIFGPWTYVQESLVDAHERGFKVKEVPCVWQERKHGDSRVVHSVFRYAYRVGPYLLFRLLRKLLRSVGIRSFYV